MCDPKARLTHYNLWFSSPGWTGEQNDKMTQRTSLRSVFLPQETKMSLEIMAIFIGGDNEIIDHN